MNDHYAVLVDRSGKPSITIEYITEERADEIVHEWGQRFPKSDFITYSGKMEEDHD